MIVSHWLYYYIKLSNNKYPNNHCYNAFNGSELAIMFVFS